MGVAPGLARVSLRLAADDRQILPAFMPTIAVRGGRRY